MKSLPSNSPSTKTKFQEGHFVIHKTLKKFSGLALDQAHMQNNTLAKSDGGAFGLAENRRALHRWMMAGLELS